MEVYIGKQPIFDKKYEVLGYELLYRGSQINSFDGTDGDKATADVIINSFLTIGMNKLTNNKKSFINFTENLLLKEIPTYFPPQSIVIEILEDIQPTKNVINTVRKMKKLGYSIALDDFINDMDHKLLVPYANYIKVDFMATTPYEQKQIIDEYRNYNIKFIAEKVETKGDFNRAISMGYDYFQGYFFSKPTIVKGNDIKMVSQLYIQLLAEINSPEPSVDKIAGMVERDLTLSFKILKLINSAAYQFRSKITSIKQAIVILGLYEVKKWIILIMFSNLTNELELKEVVKLSLSRAKIAEDLSYFVDEINSEYFLFGMFSLMDTILKAPMEDILVELPLAIEIKDGLLGKDNKYKTMLDLIRGLETADMQTIQDKAKELNIDEKMIYEINYNAIEWSNNIVNEIYCK